MESGVFAISAEALARLFIFLLYVPVVLISYRWLIPRLSPTAKFLATVMLVAQALVIVVSLEIQPISFLEWQIWHLNQEKNIPATLASTQLALVSAVALVTAWHSRTQPTLHRLYLVGIALVFLLLAREEFFETRHGALGQGWVFYYSLLGALIVAATVIVAARSPKHARIWHICLLAGLAMSAIGAIVVEQAQHVEICNTLVSAHGERCLRYFYEEPLEFLGIWITLLAVLGQFSDAAPRLRPRVRRILYLLLMFLYIHLLLPSSYLQRGPLHTLSNNLQRGPLHTLSTLPLRFEYRFLAQPLFVEFESGVGLLGYRTDSEEGALVIQLFASTASWHAYTGLGYSVHLVDQVTGESIAGLDASASRRDRWRIDMNVHGKRYLWMYKERIAVQFPAQTPRNRALWVVLTTWREEDDAFVPQKIISSDHQLLGDTQVVLGELVLPAESATSRVGSLAVFDNGFALDTGDLPDRARPGETLTIPFTWRSKADGTEDYVQFLHFGHDETGKWWVYDQQPLGARLPTRLWYGGLADSEIWQVPLPADLAPGRYKVFTGLYRASDHERLAASDAEGTPFVDARVPLGILTIERT